MRNRTELVTTTVEGSENEESGAEDSGEDWQPEKVPATGRKSAGRKSVTKTPAKRKSTSRASTASSAKKGKKPVQSEPDEEDSDDEQDDSNDDDNEDDDDDGGEESSEITRRNRRQVSGKNHPDKDGFMELYLFKNDLTKEYRTDDKLCLWRRDGASLLQKYLVDLGEETLANGSMIFKGSSVYSCWEEKRKSDFFTIKVKVVGDKRDSKVRVEDPVELDKFATEDRVPVDTTPNGADPTIESIQSTDDEEDEGEMDSDDDGEVDEDEDEE